MTECCGKNYVVGHYKDVGERASEVIPITAYQDHDGDILDEMYGRPFMLSEVWQIVAGPTSRGQYVSLVPFQMDGEWH